MRYSTPSGLRPMQDTDWHVHYRCSSGFKCFRVSSYYWQCDKKQPAMTTPSPTKRTYRPADFEQCGGLGNHCAGSKVC